MEYILELNAGNQLELPADLLQKLDVKPGAHFTATSDGAKLTIEWLPFSSQEQAKSLGKTIERLQNK